MRITLLSCAAILATAACVFSQTTQPAEYIRQLSAEDWRTREAAQAALVDLSDEAVPALSATTREASDEESRSRASAALAQIEEDHLVGPSRITLHLKDAKPQEAFAELARQARAPLEPVTPMLWQQVQAPITIDLDRQPFWSAMQALSEPTNVWLQRWGNGLRLTAGGPLIAGPRCVSGPFLITADAIERNQSIVFAANASRSEKFSLRVLVTAEPKLHVVRAAGSMIITEALDDQGNSLLPTRPPQPSGQMAIDASSWTCNGEMEYPKQNPGTSIRSLRGSVGAILVSKAQPIQFKLPLISPIEISSDGGRVTLRSAITLPDHRLEYAFDIRPKGVGSEAQAWAEQLAHADALALLDANGRAFARENVQFSSSGNRSTLTLRFSPVAGDASRPIGTPDRLVGNLILATKELSIPFSFDDLPLP